MRARHRQCDELALLLDAAERLRPFATLTPLCRPTSRGACSAPWHPKPCPSAGKRQLWADYFERRLKKDNIRQLVDRDGPINLALITTASLLVVETDSPEGEDEVVSLAGLALDETPTRERRPGRGRAWLFRAPAAVTATNRAHLGDSRAIDVRGHRGIVVIPPSVHSSGHRVTWVRSRASWEVATATLPDALVRLVGGSIALCTPGGGQASVVPAISDRVATILRAYPPVARLFDGEGKERGDETASGYDHALATELLLRRVATSEVVAVVLARPGVHRPDPAHGDRRVP